MTETTAPPPSAPPSPSPPPVGGRPLYRSSDDKVLAGVCAAVGRWTGTDPVLWRVIVVVLVFFGGAGIALYLAGWLLIPAAGSSGSPGQRALSGKRLTPIDVVVLVVLVLLGAALVGDGRGGAAVLVLAAIAFLVYRDRSHALPLGAAEPGRPHEVDAAAGAVPPVGPLPQAWSVPPTGGGPWQESIPAPAPRPPSSLGPVTIAVTSLVAGVLMAMRLGGVEELTAERILAICVVVVGAGLVVGTVLGRARWLLFPGLVLAVALAGTVAVDGVVGGGVGERTWVVAGGSPTQGFELGLGEATLDLRGLDTSGRVVVVDARVGVGHLVVLVPEDLTVRVSSSVGLGEIVVAGQERVEGSGLREDDVLGGGDIEARLSLRVGTGQVEVRRG